MNETFSSNYSLFAIGLNATDMVYVFTQPFPYG